MENDTKLKRNLAVAALVLTRPTLLFYALPWLMFLLVMGTVAQRYIGLYQSEKLFFGSFLLWLGPLPLPGAYATLGLIALCLITKLVLKSPWRKPYLGVIITHMSVIVLLVGGLVSALCREEGYMVLGPGDISNNVYDYHLHELAILKNGTQVLAVPQDALHPAAVIAGTSLPFALHVQSYCINCAIAPRTHPSPELRGAAKESEIIPAAPRQEDAENSPGAVFAVSGLSPAQDGTYNLSENTAQSTTLTQGNDRYEIILRHAERTLPFSINLIRFEKSDYPGTDMARSYRSDVMVKEGAVTWDASIEMNQPLRHAGYTLYQSSFLDNNGKLLTVLAVVKNTGALFPYIAIATLCVGLLLHLCIRFAPKAPS